MNLLPVLETLKEGKTTFGKVKTEKTAVLTSVLRAKLRVRLLQLL